MAINLQEQLAALRQRMARVDRKYAQTSDAAMPKYVGSARPALHYRPARYAVENWLSGEEVETNSGVHFQTERVYERHRRHGSIDISGLCELPEDLLDAISEGEIAPVNCRRWAFLDTETTGLAGGTGTYAFLIGVGRIDDKGFRLTQFFMRDLSEEASLLEGLAAYLQDFDVLVTYNGKTYDLPLLETRYRMGRQKPPFAAMHHLDLLFGSRRLWKLRYDSCRLVDLENQVLGVEREGDLPGEMIPYVYFEYLRTLEAWRVAPILHHNATDILTLACLTALVPWAFRSQDHAVLSHGAEMAGLGRWLESAGQHEKALSLFRRAIEKGLRDELLFRTLWDVARLEKRLGRDVAALPVYTELAECRNPFRVPALEELAKHYEHVEKNYAIALEWTLSALRFAESESLHKRRLRLERRLGSAKRTRRLL